MTEPGGFPFPRCIHFRDGKKAVAHARKACELSQWKDAYALQILAAAYAEVGRFKDAVNWQKKALEVAEFEKEQGEAARERLKLYERDRPYRDN